MGIVPPESIHKKFKLSERRLTMSNPYDVQFEAEGVAAMFAKSNTEGSRSALMAA